MWSPRGMALCCWIVSGRVPRARTPGSRSVGGAGARCVVCEGIAGKGVASRPKPALPHRPAAFPRSAADFAYLAGFFDHARRRWGMCCRPPPFLHPASPAMLLHATRPLFAWSELEDSPSLQTIRAVLSSLPDQTLLDGLQQARGHGRDDYPLRVLWGVTVLSVLCRHVWLNDCLAELHRNPTPRHPPGR